MTWFEQLFGFEETSYAETKSQLFVRDGRLHSRANGASFAVGEFTTPTLNELRARGRALARPGTLQVTHEVIGDVLELHALAENRGAMFQVASQFNCLEFPGPSTTPESGVTDYASDPTQGPACSLAAAGATVARNYFAPVGGQEGQTRDRQLDNLDSLARHLGGAGQFWEIRNGYTFASPEQLVALAKELKARDRDQVMGEIKIGIHRDVGVTFADRYTSPPKQEPLVSQAFCSAVSCAYSNLPVDAWRPLATLVLDAAYEATLWAAVANAARTNRSSRVWLTFLGGGAFGNDRRWIAGAVKRALVAVGDVGLDVRIAHYRRIDHDLRDSVDSFQGA